MLHMHGSEECVKAMRFYTNEWLKLQSVQFKFIHLFLHRYRTVHILQYTDLLHYWIVTSKRGMEAMKVEFNLFAHVVLNCQGSCTIAIIVCEGCRV